MFDKVERWFGNYLCNFEIEYDKKYNFIKTNYVKILNSKETENSFKISNFKPINGFFVKENEIIKIINTKEYFTINPITKNLPPSVIQINYDNCNIRFDISGNSEFGYIYNQNKYIPQNKKLLRYSENGVVTQDYIPCRITLFGKGSVNPYSLSIEKNFYIFNKDEFENNKIKFNGLELKDYNFDFNWNCYCTKEYTKVVTIVVKNKSIQNNFGTIKYYTLAELFDYVEKTINSTKNPHKVNIRYNPEFGYIEEFYIDKDQYIADEEIGFVVKNFKE